MDGSSSILIVMSLMALIAVFAGLILAFIATGRSGSGHAADRRASADGVKRTTAAGRTARPPRSGLNYAAPLEYLYVPCVGLRHHGCSAERGGWVQEVLIVRKTARWIYYTSDTRDRREALISPGRISRQGFETDTRCHNDCPACTRGVCCAKHGCRLDHCPHREDRCCHGYPAGVIPIPGDRPRPGPAGRLFFATHEAAEDDLYRGERERAQQAARQASPIRKLRRAMADAHPDRGGTVEQFIEARRQYETALRPARR
jgi:hypothetical protein